MVFLLETYDEIDSIGFKIITRFLDLNLIQFDKISIINTIHIKLKNNYHTSQVKKMLCQYLDKNIVEYIFPQYIDNNFYWVPFCTVPQEIEPDTSFDSFRQLFRDLGIDKLYIEFGGKYVSGKIHVLNNNVLKYDGIMCGSPYSFF